MGLTGGRGRVETPAHSQQWPESVVDEARDVGLPEDVITDGGDYRENQFGVKYWLELDHLIEFEKADQSIDDDAKFWTWFREYRDKHKIYSGAKSAPYMGSTWKDTYQDTKRNYMTSWWSGWGYSSGTEDSRKLAIALGAVQSIVSVINDTAKKYRVELASDDGSGAPRSYTSFDEQLVVVSPQALLDRQVGQDDGIEVTAGWGLHEASHVKYTTDVIEVLRLPTQLEPLLVAGHLLNLIEDVRIEAETSRLFPGFEGYFHKANNYLWDKTCQHAPKKWGPELGDKLNTITAITKWATEYAPIVAASKDQQLKDEFTWFSDWNDRYQKGTLDARSALVEALKHLNEDPQTAKQMKAQAAAEGGSAKLTDDQFRDFLDQLKKGIKFGGCPSPNAQGKPVKLSLEQAEEVNRLLREQYREMDPIVGDSTGGAMVEKIEWTKPEEDRRSKGAYRKPTSLVAKLRQAFVFRKITPDWYERLQRSGDLDEDMLWRVGGYDLRVMQRRNTVDTPKTQITLLVDMSGSMGGRKAEIAQDLANTMLECLRTMKGVTVRVRGHTNWSSSCMITRIWEPGDPVTRIGLLSTGPRGGTPDGLALDGCGQELIRNEQPGEDKIIIILSDGMPNGSAALNMNGPQYVRKVVDELRRRGVHVVQIAVDAAVREPQQASMYGTNYVMYKNDAALPGQLTKLLIRLFGGQTA